MKTILTITMEILKAIGIFLLGPLLAILIYEFITNPFLRPLLSPEEFLIIHFIISLVCGIPFGVWGAISLFD